MVHFRLVILSLVLGLSSAAHATIVTLDFNDQAPRSPIPGASPGTIVSQGFTLLSNQDFGISAAPDTEVIYCPDCVTILSQTNGDTFALLSADLRIIGASSARSPLLVIGQSLGFGEVVTDFLPDGINVAETVLFGAQWLDLQQVIFFGSSSLIGQGIDNIVLEVQAIPLPAAVWLFGSAIAGLVWMRRGHNGGQDNEI